jgi:hypothetical protein
MRGAIAILCGVAVAVVTAIPLACLGHGLEVWVAWVALLLGVAVAILVLKSLPSIPVKAPIGTVGWVMILIFSTASARAFLWLIYPSGDSWNILSPNNLGDLSLHIAFIRWLAGSPHWWPESPILVGDPLRYPLGSDLWNALLLKIGIPLEAGLVWCGVVGATLAGIALWRWGTAVALAAFLFNDGIGRLFLAKKEGVDPEEILQWKNFFLTLFVTQRGFLFSLPAGLILLSAWKSEFFGVRKRMVPLPVQVLLLAATPLFSVHAALFLGVSMTGLWVLAPGARRVLEKLALLAWPLMALCGWLVTTGAGGPSAVGTLGVAPGWMSDGTVGFWFWNFGFTLPLGIVFCLLLARHGSSAETRAFVWPAALVFAACLIIRFAPWPWDNTKLMLWSWIVIAPFLWEEFLSKRSLPLRAVAALLLFGSGAVTLAMGLDERHGYTLVKRSDLDRASSLLRGVPPGAVIACAPEYNQPVLMLGHPVVCGYEGHLWSHGLDYKKRLDALNSLMNGEPEWQRIAIRLGVSRIFWGEPEKERWPDSKFPWAKDSTPSLHSLAD